MNLEKLFQLQRILDDRIEIKHNINNSDLLHKKILALLVEVGELANETKCFKYWSNKEPSPKNIVIEEYIDCLHFILSIGLEKGIDKLIIENTSIITVSCSDMLLSLFNYIIEFRNQPSIESYTNMFKCLLALGYTLGFTENEIIEAYISKNSINHQRQDNEY